MTATAAIPQTSITSSITPRDRLGFTLFLAASLHAALILGVSFSSELNLEESPSIEVTLALSNDLEAPEEADFLAATNQQGSGTESEAAEMTTTERTDFHDTEFKEVLAQEAQSELVPDSQQEFVTTIADADEFAADEEIIDSQLVDSPLPITPLAREELVREIASLEARIAQEQQALARLPKTKRLGSVSTKSASEAAYLNMWRAKCERIARNNYPSGDLQGNVLMLVVIEADGSLEEVRILKSSGKRELDNVVLNTVRQAAPFQPFSVDMRKQYDRLEFTRTWQFIKGGTDIGG